MFSRQAKFVVIKSAVTSFSIPQHTHLHMHTCTDHLWWGTQAVWHWSCAYVYVLIAYVMLTFMMCFWVSKRNHTFMFLTQSNLCFCDFLHASLSSVFVVRWILPPFEQQQWSWIVPDLVLSDGLCCRVRINVLSPPDVAVRTDSPLTSSPQNLNVAWTLYLLSHYKHFLSVQLFTTT